MKPRPAPHSGSLVPPAAKAGAVIWIVAVAQFFVVQLVVESGWRTPYSWAANNISDLGNIHCGTWDASRPRYVCSPWHDAMNASFVAHGVLLLAGTLLAGACWGRGGAAVTARILMAVNAGGWVLVGLVPADADENVHVLGALLIMGLGNLGLLCTGLVPGRSLFGRLRAVSLVLAALAVAAAGMFFAQADPGTGLGGLERVAAFGVDAWALVMAVAMLRAARGAGAVTPEAVRSR